MNKNERFQILNLKVKMYCYLTVDEFLEITSFPEDVKRLHLKNKFVEDHVELVTDEQFIEIVKRCIKSGIDELVFIGLSFLQIFNWENHGNSRLLENDLIKQFKPRTLEFYSCDGTIPLIRNLRKTKVWNKTLNHLTVKNTNPFDDIVERQIVKWLKVNHRFIDVKYIPRILYSKDANKNDYFIQYFDKEICSFLTRNRNCREDCSKGCITLLMIWKYRRGESNLSLIDKNIILKIIQILWSDFYVKPHLIKDITN